MWYIAPSSIHGVGVFTSRNLFPGEHVSIAIDKHLKITSFGSKINHSYSPNCTLGKNSDGSFGMYTFRHVPMHSELTLDYMYTPDFIKKPDPAWSR